MIGRFIDVTASPHEVVARHGRSWAKHGVITDPAHVATAATLRRHHID